MKEEKIAYARMKIKKRKYLFGLPFLFLFWFLGIKGLDGVFKAYYTCGTDWCFYVSDAFYGGVFFALSIVLTIIYLWDLVEEWVIGEDEI